MDVLILPERPSQCTAPINFGSTHRFLLTLHNPITGAYYPPSPRQSPPNPIFGTWLPRTPTPPHPTLRFPTAVPSLPPPSSGGSRLCRWLRCEDACCSSPPLRPSQPPCRPPRRPQRQVRPINLHRLFARHLCNQRLDSVLVAGSHSWWTLISTRPDAHLISCIRVNFRRFS